MQKILELQPKDFMKGLATGEYINDGLFEDMKGVDIFVTPLGLLKPAGASTDISSGVVADIIGSVARREWNEYYGIGSSGFLYKITNSNTTVLDSGNESGRDGGDEVILYKNKLHYFHNAGCGTYDLSTTFNNSAYTTNITSYPHPALIFQDILYFGNGQYLGEIDNTTLNAQKLDLGSDYKIQDIKVYNNYIAILVLDKRGGYSGDENSSKLFLWNGYSDKIQYEYSIDEKCTALEKYKTTLAVFGKHLMLFNGGSFDIIRRIYEVSRGETYFGRGMLYFVNRFSGDSNYSLFTYGSPTSSINTSVQTCLYDIPHSGKLMNTDRQVTRFIITGTDGTNRVFRYDLEGYPHPSVKTKYFNLEHTSIEKISMSFEPLTSGDGLTIRLTDNKETIANLVVNYTNDGAINYKEWIIATKPINNAQIKLIWDSNSKIKIENITLYGDRKKRPA